MVCLFLVLGDFLNLVLKLISNVITVSIDEMNQFGVDSIIIDNFGHFGEMPCEPLLQAHDKSVDVLVELVDKGDSLNNWLILTIDILGTSVAGVGVTKTELGSLDVRFIDFYKNGVLTDILYCILLMILAK